jgi:hypothetical protein
MLAFPYLKFRGPTGWNEAIPDDDMLTIISLSGCLGELAQAVAKAKIDASVRAMFDDND